MIEAFLHLHREPPNWTNNIGYVIEHQLHRAKAPHHRTG